MRLLVLFMLILLIAPGAASAQEPTEYPTFTPWPTLEPLQPTVTSPYQSIRATPTFLPITPYAPVMEEFQVVAAAGALADQVIQGYNSLNVSGALDMFSFIAMVMIVIAMLVRIHNRSTRRHD